AFLIGIISTTSSLLDRSKLTDSRRSDLASLCPILAMLCPLTRLPGDRSFPGCWARSWWPLRVRKPGDRVVDDRIGEQALADRENREVLYPDETKVGQLILGHRAREWPAKAALLGREGLPRIDPLMGGRFWPAVKRWFFNRHGLDVE